MSSLGPIPARRPARRRATRAVSLGAALLSVAVVGTTLAGCGSSTPTTSGHAHVVIPASPAPAEPASPETEATTAPTSTPAADASPAATPTERPKRAAKPAAKPAPTRTPSPKATPRPAPSPTKSPAPTPTAPEPAAHKDLQSGDTGARVTALQKRLVSLGYWISDVDGTYGPSTLQAVWAVQKAAGTTRDGVVGPNTRKALEDGVRPHARTHSGHVIEVDLARQLVLLVDDGHVSTILNTSTGSGQKFKGPAGQQFTATTPTGTFQIGRQYDKLYTSSLGLGTMWRPKFFNGGIALHGDGYAVPAYPASHGCVRVSNPAMDWIWSTNKAPQGTEVLVY
jgi:lipoprotein-anchoring transpeptidase ErfK/SrfK